MADLKLTDLDALGAVEDDDLLYIVDDPGGSPASKKITMGNAVPLRKAGNGYALGPDGGNARGAAAVDLQTTRTADTQVASGTVSAIGGGFHNTASGLIATVVGGSENTASGAWATVLGGNANQATTQNTIAGGQYANATRFGQIALANGRFSAVGDSQLGIIVLKALTTDATPTVMYPNDEFEFNTIADDTVWNFRAEIVAMTADAAKYAAYTVVGLVKRANGTVAVAGVATTTINESDGGWDATAEADDTNKALSIKVTGAAGTTIRWVAAVYTTEVTFAS